MAEQYVPGRSQYRGAPTLLGYPGSKRNAAASRFASDPMASCLPVANRLCQGISFKPLAIYSFTNGTCTYTHAGASNRSRSNWAMEQQAQKQCKPSIRERSYMKQYHRLLQGLALLALLAINHQLSTAHAQGTAFSYQGRLNDGNAPANGFYDLQFTVYDTLESGNTVGSPVTIGAVGVTNGLFTVMLDFGIGVFTGAPRWLDIGVRTNGTGIFTVLVPRQALTASPYAVLAGDVAAANIARLNLTGTTTPATGVPAIMNGFVVGAAVASGGSGYLTAPGVILNNTGGGSGAAITANISGGRVMSFTVTDAGFGYSPSTTLAVGSPPNNAYQVFAGANYFSGINQMNNSSNTFSGSFSGNGAGLTNLPAVVPWRIVSGAAVQAMSSTGYLLTNAQRVTITLPVSPNPGDIVRVSGCGAGGWKIVQNPGQQVLTDALGHTYLRCVASSADGSRLVAGGDSYSDNGQLGAVLTSSDSGATWAMRTVPGDGYDSFVASSADGTKLVAASYGIYTSSDGGATWTQTSAPNANWRSVASSADGTKLVAATYSEHIYISTNSGTTWTQTTAPATNWTSVASSSDGTKLVAANNGSIYTSANAGALWTQASVPSNSWASVASSADGARLVAASGSGFIYTWASSGTNWTLSTAANISWRSVASSADGNKLVAVGGSGAAVYTSADAGGTWSTINTPFNSAWESWSSVACAADGSKFVAVAGDQLYASMYPSQSRVQTATLSGSAGYLIAEQGGVIELQYISDGQFYVLSCRGVISAH